MHHARLGFLCVAALGLLGGCGSGGPDVSYVEGTVTLDGSPLPGATVTFSPVEGGTGKPATGKTDDSGVYKLTDMQSEDYGSGAVPGEYRVGIIKVTPPPATAVDTDDPNYGDIPTSTGTQVFPSEIPTTYNNPATSGLTATVADGENTGVNFELSSNP